MSYSALFNSPLVRVCGLACVLFLGLLLVVLACIQETPASAYPLVGVLVCMCAPWPLFLCRSRMTRARATCHDASGFMTGACFAVGFGLPLIFAHATRLSPLAALLAIIGSSVAGGAVAAYMHVFTRRFDAME